MQSISQNKIFKFYNTNKNDIQIGIEEDQIIVIKNNKKKVIKRDNFLGCRIYKMENNLNKPKLEFIYCNIM